MSRVPDPRSMILVPPTDLLDILASVQEDNERRLPQLLAEESNLTAKLHVVRTEIDRTRRVNEQIKELRHGRGYVG